MSNESKALAIVPSSIDEVTSLAEVLSKSTLLPDALKGKVPDIVVSILAGRELGLSPMAAIRGVFVVQGKPVLSADTMVGLVLGSGLAEYFSCVEDTDQRVTYETKRKGSPHPQRSSWSVEDTKRAGLNTKDNWRTYTRQMMKARAKAILARDAYPDVLAGCYDPDELRVEAASPAVERVPVASDDVPDAEIVQSVNLDDIERTETEDQLKGLVDSLNRLAGEEKKQARARYEVQLKKLRSPVTATT